MKKLFLFLSVCFGVSQSFQAQQLKMCGYQGYQTVEEVTSACDLQGALAATDSSEDAAIVVDNILDKVGLFRNFLVEECDNINNALAVTMPLEGGDIDRYILYDEAFFQKVSASTGTDWGLTSILAHEVGHHLNGHTLKGGGSNHKVELQADEFSGFVLARMGCSLSDAQSAVSKLLPEEASATHPAKQDRLNAIEIGWNRGNGKTIIVKKIEEVEDPSDITAEQVIANYLDAIGGQEKIVAIKTFSKDEITTEKQGYSTTKVTTKSNTSYKYLSPSLIFKNATFKIKGYGTNNIVTLDIGEKKFYKKEDKWVKVNVFDSLNYKKVDVSYIPEYSLLLNNYKAENKGVKMIDKVRCYEIQYREEVVGNDITTQTTKYFSVETGFLIYEEILMKMRFDKNKVENEFIHKKYYRDYRAVDGILFSHIQETEGIFNIKGKVYTVNKSTKIENIKINPVLVKNEFEITN